MNQKRIKMGMKFDVMESMCLSFGLALVVVCSHAKPLVPALIVFGDSLVDVGNNNYLVTYTKSNFPPYGRDFINQEATGRFSNGKLLSDFTADILGFTSYPKAFLSPQASGENLLIGANFASAGSGNLNSTAAIFLAIPLLKQLDYYKVYQEKLAVVAGSTKAKAIVEEAVYLVSIGNNDFVNYVVNPVVNRVYTRPPDEYSSNLIAIFSSFIGSLYGLGARRIATFSLIALGCTPAAITVFGLLDQKDCIAALNLDAQLYNSKLNTAAATLSQKYPDLKLIILDIYTPVYDIFQNPSNYGFAEARRGCCGTGLIETTIVLCNPLSVTTCKNASQFVYWDIAHPTEATSQILADSVISKGIHGLIS